MVNKKYECRARARAQYFVARARTRELEDGRTEISISRARAGSLRACGIIQSARVCAIDPQKRKQAEFYYCCPCKN